MTAAYLYSRGGDCPLFFRYLVTKRTAKRVYFQKRFEVVNARGVPIAEQWCEDEGIGFLTRRVLDTLGWDYPNPFHPMLFATWEALAAYCRRCGKPSPHVDLAALKAAMAAAHPDHGGTAETFIKAHATYVAARKSHDSARGE